MLRVTNMYGMFFSVTSFDNVDLLEWDVSSVTNMIKMFNGVSFFARTLCGALHVVI